jgi:DNA replication protein DnaC
MQRKLPGNEATSGIPTLLFAKEDKAPIIGIANSKKEAKMELRSRFFQGSPRSYFLFGPRGTGKST